MTRPLISQVTGWQIDVLRTAADGWETAAVSVTDAADDLCDELPASTGDTARAAQSTLAAAVESARHLGRGLITAAVAARDGAQHLSDTRQVLLELVAEVRQIGFVVADDGTVTAGNAPDGLLRLLAGSDAEVAGLMLAGQAGEFTDRMQGALDSVGDADARTARAIDDAFSSTAETTDTAPAPTQPASAGAAAAGVVAWPSMDQDHIAAQIAAMSPAQRAHLVETAPLQVGNTDGVPWPMRVAANRLNIADAILAERRSLDLPDPDKVRVMLGADVGGAGAERVWPAALANPATVAAAVVVHDQNAKQRMAFYQGMLAEVPDPTRRSAERVERQIIAFDPAQASLVELSGDLASATSVGVLIPGLGTTIAGSAADAQVAQRFVAAGNGRVAMISYLGGPFPTGTFAAGLVNAADPGYALRMAPRLVAFSEDVDRTVDATGRSIPVTYIGHSYGGSILGTAERLGLTADRTVYVEAAGAGVGVQSPADWHNTNPDILRFSMTAPGDPIALVQGIPMGPHGADPDEMPGVIRLDTGRRMDGSVMAGLPAHSDVFAEPSDAWRNILGVITGDRNLIRVYRSAG